MLRAIGARIEKTTNHEACRDLNGRRMRDVNNEKKYVLYIVNLLLMKDLRDSPMQKKIVLFI